MELTEHSTAYIYLRSQLNKMALQTLIERHSGRQAEKLETILIDIISIIHDQFDRSGVM